MLLAQESLSADCLWLRRAGRNHKQSAREGKYRYLNSSTRKPLQATARMIYNLPLRNIRPNDKRKPTPMSEPLTLMIIHAHPDDEVIGSGGTLAHYSDEGINTVLVTATLGEEGEIVVADMDTPENHARLAEIRLEELRKATEILGIKHQAFLGY